jgi:hypothetical protein
VKDLVWSTFRLARSFIRRGGLRFVQDDIALTVEQAEIPIYRNELKVPLFCSAIVIMVI